MIFNNNSTMLGASSIPMAEGYDCATGPALALYESAQNDFNMFKAMIGADFRELSIRNESAAGYVTEGEITSLHEAVGGGIFKKIVELFKKLIAKVKSIFHNFVARFRSLYMKDKDLVKKYGTEVLRKDNIDKLEVKWRKTTNVKPSDMINKIVAVEASTYVNNNYNNLWDEDQSERTIKACNNLFGLSINDYSDFSEELENKFFEDDSQDTYEVSDLGGMRNIIGIVSNYDSEFKNVEKASSKYEKTINKAIKTFNDAADEAVKDKKLDAPNEATKKYDVAVAYQTVVLRGFSICLSAMTTNYKQAKAAFMKSIAVNPKKLKESMIYAEAVADVAANEVEDVITSAVEKDAEGIEKVSAAYADVCAPDVNGSSNTYGDGYTERDAYSPVKSESSFFSEPLY